MRTSGFILLVALLPAIPAAADVIGPNWRRPSCPAQTCEPTTSPAPSGSHSGCSPGCQPNAECAADADCEGALGAGATCRPARHCLAERFAPRMGPVHVVVGACDAAGACAEGTCSAVSRCVPPPPPPPARAPEPAPTTAPAPTTDAGGGGCTAAAARSEAPALSVLALAFAFRLGRRRRS